eukprot:scaffold290809_cov38-Prasinocladus_malaysianus.AAC.1
METWSRMMPSLLSCTWRNKFFLAYDIYPRAVHLGSDDSAWTSQPISHGYPSTPQCRALLTSGLRLIIATSLVLTMTRMMITTVMPWERAPSSAR